MVFVEYLGFKTDEYHVFQLWNLVFLKYSQQNIMSHGKFKTKTKRQL